MRRDLSRFDAGDYDKPNKVRLALWFAVSETIFRTWCVPSSTRIWLLRLFGAEIGAGVRIRERVYVHHPWNLSIGDRSQIGREAMIMNHVAVRIGNDVMLSQRTLVSSSGHDPDTVGLDFRHREVQIEDGAWVTAGAAVLPGAVVRANQLVRPLAVVYPDRKRDGLANV